MSGGYPRWPRRLFWLRALLPYDWTSYPPYNLLPPWLFMLFTFGAAGVSVLLMALALRAVHG